MIKITYFVHTTTIQNEKEIAAGWTPGELSEIGIKQAIELGKIKSTTKFNAIISSDLKRAIDTAKLAFKDKYKIISDNRLREINYGEFTNKPLAQFRSNRIYYVTNPFPSGESYKDVEKRILGFLTFLKKDYSGNHVAIVAHHAPQLALDVVLKGKTWSQAIAEDWRRTKEWKPGWEYFIQE